MTNLQSSLFKEFLITSRSGAYCSTSLVGCNIRKYHGLLVAPVAQIDGENHVFISSLDETVVQHGAEFNLGLHKYQGENYSPKGNKYIQTFEWTKNPTWIYRIGGVLLKKEIVYGVHDSRLYIRYTLLEAHSPTTLRLKPFLAFRNVRHWTHANDAANKGYENISDGIRMKLYEGYPYLNMQLTSKDAQFHYDPNWYMGLEYPKERERGYDSVEDLLVPGYFEMPITKEQPIIFSASVSEAIDTEQLEAMMNQEIEPRLPLDSFYHCLMHAAHQFKYIDHEETYALAGYHWFKSRARDLFISLPGLTLAIEEYNEYDNYMATAQKAVEAFMAGKPCDLKIYEIEQPDVLLWATYCLQQYAKYTSKNKFIKKYGAFYQSIMRFIREDRHENLHPHENGLLYSHGKDKAITWMNATIDGRPIVPRSGYIVEFNALWYNALKFYEEILPDLQHDADELIEVAQQAERCGVSFKQTFLNEHGYLLDYVDGQMMDWSVRPNQIFALALDYSPLDKRECKGVLDICTKELVTPKGIRSLSPKSGGYTPMYVGQQRQRDYAYHNGTAWPWLTSFYLAAYLKVYKISGINYIERQLIGYEEELFYHCVGTIPEVFDGNPSFSGRGAVSFAMNVAGILVAIRLLEKYRMLEEGLMR